MNTSCLSVLVLACFIQASYTQAIGVSNGLGLGNVINLNNNANNGNPGNGGNGAAYNGQGSLSAKQILGNGLAGGNNVGYGDVALAGELPIGGSTAVTGNLPVIGYVTFEGNLPAGGVVSVITNANNC